MASILPSGYTTPGIFISTKFAQGPASAGAGDYSVILLGNKSAAGSATVDTTIYGIDTPVAMANETDVIALFGAGSELHRMARRFMKVNKTTKLYAIAVAEGDSAIKATGTITLATAATGFGTLRVFIADEFVDVGIATGDSITSIGDRLVSAINSLTHLPVTASNSSGIVTITAKCAGTRGNLIRYSAQMLGAPGTTVTPVATTACTTGSVADSVANALSAIKTSGKRFYYHVPAHTDATNLGLIKDQINELADPTIGIRQRMVAGSVDSLGNATTITTALNDPRCELVWQSSSDWTPAELAANCVAVYSAEEAPTDFRMNFNGYGNDPSTAGRWFVPAPRSSGVAPTPAQVEASLQVGLTPIKVEAGNSTSLVKRITTRFKSGSVSDYRIRSSHKITEVDKFADKLGQQTAFVMSGKQIAEDPTSANDYPPPNAMTPNTYKNMILQSIREEDASGRLKNVGDIIRDTVVRIAPDAADRIEAYIPIQVIEIWNQTTLDINEVG